MKHICPLLKKRKKWSGGNGGSGNGGGGNEGSGNEGSGNEGSGFIVIVIGYKQKRRKLKKEKDQTNKDENNAMVLDFGYK